MLKRRDADANGPVDDSYQLLSPDPNAMLSLRWLALAHGVVALEVLLLGLQPYALLLIYLSATLTDAVLNSLRILIVGMAGEPLGSRIGFAGPFSALFSSLLVIGFFWSKFGAALLIAAGMVIFLPGYLAGVEGAEVLHRAHEEFSQNTPLILFGSAALMLSQIFDFLFGFLGGRQYRSLRWWTLLLRPYLSLIASTVLLGVTAFLASQQQMMAPQSALALLLVVAKLLADVAIRRRDPAVGPARA